MLSKKRLRNKAMWVSLASQFILLAQLIAFTVWGLPTNDPLWLTVGAIVNAVLGILSTLGIISNPTKPDSGGYNL